MEEEFYGVGGGGKCGWEIMMQEYMYAMCEGKMDFSSESYIHSTVQYMTYSTEGIGYRYL